MRPHVFPKQLPPANVHRDTGLALQVSAGEEALRLQPGVHIPVEAQTTSDGRIIAESVSVIEPATIPSVPTATSAPSATPTAPSTSTATSAPTPVSATRTPRANPNEGHLLPGPPSGIGPPDDLQLLDKDGPPANLDRPEEGGPRDDIGPPADAELPADIGPPADMGRPPDAGAPDDAGPPEDVGYLPMSGRQANRVDDLSAFGRL